MICNFLLNNNKKCKNKIKGKNIACHKHIFNFLDYKLFDMEIDIFTYDIQKHLDIDNNINYLNEYTKTELIIKIQKLDKQINNLKLQINELNNTSIERFHTNNYISYDKFILIPCHFCKIIFKIETKTYDLMGSSCNFYCHECYSSKYELKK